jgi:hypothetical protein
VSAELPDPSSLTDDELVEENETVLRLQIVEWENGRRRNADTMVRYRMELWEEAKRRGVKL